MAVLKGVEIRDSDAKEAFVARQRMTMDIHGWKYVPMNVLTTDRVHLGAPVNAARWSGATRNWSPVSAVTLNLERDSVVKTHSEHIDKQQLAA